MQKINTFLTDTCIYICKNNIHTSIYGLSRSLLAIGTFLTIAFNDVNSLFPNIDINNQGFIPGIKLTTFSIFSILHDYPIEYSKYLCLFLLFTVIIGIYPKITCLFHWFVSYSFFFSCPIVDGGDQITMIISLLLIPVGLTDNRKWHWSNIPTETEIQKIIGYISLNVIRVQVAVVYFHAGTAKFQVFEWLNGTATYYWFNHNIFGMPYFLRSIINPILGNSIFVVLLTWSVLLFEVFLFLCLVIDKKYWKLFLIMGISFHFFILIIHGLVTFFFAMAGALILYLTPINEPYSFPNHLFDNIRKKVTQYWLKVNNTLDTPSL